MGWFGRSKKNKERKAAQESLKHLEKTKRSSKSMTTSAVDPSRAITELQPFQVNQEKARQGLSQFSHKDVWGREIKEPDLTNPTRNRWERPLDTIRSFQESIDRGYRRSYYGGEEGGPVTAPPSQAGRSFVRGAEATADGMHYNHMPYRMGNSLTPLSQRSLEDPHAAFGAHTGRNHLNESLVATGHAINHRAKHYSSGSGGYADTGYGESVNHGSRGNSSGNVEAEWAAGNGAAENYGYSGGPYGGNGYPPNNSYPVSPSGAGPSVNTWGAPSGGAHPTSPLQQQVSSSPERKHVIKLSDSPPTGLPVEQEPKRKSWIGRRFSKD